MCRSRRSKSSSTGGFIRLPRRSDDGLACHQLQVGTWALGMLPAKVMGHGSINYWKKGREVYDNVNLIYVFPDGRKDDLWLRCGE